MAFEDKLFWTQIYDIPISLVKKSYLVFLLEIKNN